PLPLAPAVPDVSDVAMAADGRWAAVWVEDAAVLLRLFPPDDDAPGPPVRLDSGAPPPGTVLLGRERPAIALGPGGDGVAMWVERLIAPESGFDFELRRLVSRRLAAAGQPLGPEVER